MVTHVLLAQARENEMKYFEGHPQYRQILSRCGTKHLSESLNKVCQHLLQAASPFALFKFFIFLDPDESHPKFAS